MLRTHQDQRRRWALEYALALAALFCGRSRRLASVTQQVGVQQSPGRAIVNRRALHDTDIAIRVKDHVLVNLEPVETVGLPEGEPFLARDDTELTKARSRRTDPDQADRRLAAISGPPPQTTSSVEPYRWPTFP